ncbi:MAG: hypothetical protein GY778_18750, partial [bacterium]|nr:hypothetical protein [bacterium]
LICTARQREIYRDLSDMGLPPVLERSEGDPPSGIADVDAAYDYLGDTYDYFQRGFGRDSIDGAGLVVEALVGMNSWFCPNAFWSGSTQSMYFCWGVVSDDVVAHEFTHGVTEHTAQLIYQNQSGQLNESFSDVFGELVDLFNGDVAFAGQPGGDPWPTHPTGPGLDTPNERRGPGCSRTPDPTEGVRWLLAEDAVAFGGEIRDMWKPICFGHPDSANHPYQTCSDYDSGGVHSGSGVPNHAFALLTDGGSFGGHTIIGIGPIKAGAVWYRALTTYLTPAADFEDAYYAINQAAADLVGTFPNDPRTGAPYALAFTAADAADVDQALLAVEMNTEGLCGANDPADYVVTSDPAPPCGAGAPVYADDFESGPNGWTVSNSGPPTPYDWQQVSQMPFGRSGTAWFCEDRNIGDCDTQDESGVHSLTSPSIALPGFLARPVLRFTHYLATEQDWDGGNVKIRVNGGLWQLLPATAFHHNPYNRQIAAVERENTNPLAGEDAWSGIGGRWGTSMVDLSGLVSVGDDVQFRFDLGKDGCTGFVGWYLDDFMVADCADCNSNGTADYREIVHSTASGLLQPIGGGAPQSYTIPSPPPATDDVVLTFHMFGRLDVHDQQVAVDINGVSVGAVFDGGWGDYCGSYFATASADQLVIAAAEFNNAVAGGDAVVNLVPTVGMPVMCPGDSFISVISRYEVSGGDCNENNQLDACDLSTGASGDCNTNGIPDECEPDEDCNTNGVQDICDLAAGTSSDCNANAVPDSCDLASGASYDCNTNGTPDECEFADCNLNCIPDSQDISQGTSPDCNSNGTPDECDVTSGASADCNTNGTPDECDLAAGASEDCNENVSPDECDIAAGTSLDQLPIAGDGIPDECQSDCNGNVVPDADDIDQQVSEDSNSNGVPDECDILAGRSQDCNANDIPDECEPDCNGTAVPDDCDIAEFTALLVSTLSFGRLESDVQSVASADFDGNGHPDVAVAVGSTSQIAGFSNDAAGGFNGPDLYLVGQRPRGVVAVDVDRDGYPDLAVANRDDATVSMLQNTNGTGFQTPVDYGVQGSPQQLAAGDLNGDTYPDLVVPNEAADTVSVLINNGLDGQNLWLGYAPAVHVAVGQIPVAVAIGDWSGDGAADAVVANQISNTVSLLANTGTGQLVNIGSVSVGGAPNSIVLPDLDLDGRLDMAVACADSDDVRVLRNAGSGIFYSVANPSAGDQPKSLAAWDYDRDGDEDLAIAAAQDARVVVLTNNGDLTFTWQSDVAAGLHPISITVADFNGDTRDDLVVADTGNPHLEALSLLLNRSFGGNPDCNGNGMPDDCDIAAGTSDDLNGDGIPDECAVDCNQNGVPDEQEPDCNTNGQPDDCDIANGQSQDVDSNGLPDECETDCNTNQIPDAFDISTGSSADCNANGSPDECDLAEVQMTFDNAQHMDALLSPVAIDAADVNGDGFGDVFVANELSDAVSVFLSLDASSYAPPVHYPVGSIPSDVQSADMNDDDILDLVVVVRSGHRVSVLLNNGDGSFGLPVEFAISFTPQRVMLADLDLDDSVDLVVSNKRSIGGDVAVLINLGTDGLGNWLGLTAPVEYDLNSTPLAIAVAPLDTDQYPDLAITDSGADLVSILFNLGDGTFGLPTDYTVNSNPFDLVAGDFDQDDDLDLVVAASSWGRLVLLFNDGAGGFGIQSSIDAGAVPRSVTSGDFDGNGTLDLAAGDFQRNEVQVFLGHGDATFDLPVALPVNQDPHDIASFDLDGNGAVDLVTANRGTNDVSRIYNRTPPHSADVNGNGVPDECEQPPIYVDADANGANDGSTWTDAFTDLQDALAAAAASPGGVRNIWVAEGTYTPAGPGGDRTLSFVMLDGVGVYGGFAGVETAFDERDPALHVTNLSGDLDGNDGPGTGHDENAHHVVRATSVGASAILNGFVIQGGNADEFPGPHAYGGGLLIEEASPTVTHCIIRDNTAAVGGRAYPTRPRGQPTLGNCLLLG